MSSVGSMSSPRFENVALSSLVDAARIGRKSPTAAAMTTTVAQFNRVFMAFDISSAVVMLTQSIPGGAGNVVGPLTSTTDAPRALAASAVAYPIFPEDRLAI